MTAIEMFDQSGAPTAEAIGAALKEHGQRRALENAGDDWRVQILAEFRSWCATRAGQDITVEEFRAQVPSGLHPGSSKSWGVLPRLAIAEGLIAPKVDGEGNPIYRPARNPRTHAHPVRVWRVL